MKPGIRMTKVWFDNDMIEVKIEVSDGTSLFSTDAHALLVASFADKDHDRLLAMRLREVHRRLHCAKVPAPIRGDHDAIGIARKRRLRDRHVGGGDGGAGEKEGEEWFHGVTRV